MGKSSMRNCYGCGTMIRGKRKYCNHCRANIKRGLKLGVPIQRTGPIRLIKNNGDETSQ